MSKKNNIALITGASSGIGQSVAVELSKKGFEVIISSRNIDGLNHTKELINSVEGKSHIVQMDILNHKSVENLFIESQKIGFVDVVINNAGLGKFDRIENISLEDWDMQINVNLRGAFLITQAFSKPMIENKNGMFVYINSVAGKKGYAFSSAYVTSKFGLLGFSKSMRNELREHNIKVISIHPGAVDTNFWNNVKGDFPRDEMMSSENVAKSIVHAISAPDNIVLEEIDIQRTAGNF